MSSYIELAQLIAAPPGAKELTNVKPVIEPKMPAIFLQHVRRSVRRPAETQIKSQQWNPSTKIDRKDQSIKPLPGKKLTVESSVRRPTEIKIKPRQWNPSTGIDRKDQSIKPLPGKKQTLESLKKQFRARLAPSIEAAQPSVSVCPSQPEEEAVKVEPTVQTESPDEVCADKTAVDCPPQYEIVEETPKIDQPLPPADPLIRIPIRIEINLRTDPSTGLPAISSLTVSCFAPVPEQVAKASTNVETPSAVRKSRIPIRIPPAVGAQSIPKPASATTAFKSKIPIRIGSGLRK